MKSDELRQRFLRYFEEHGHKVVPSSSLLPTDPSVLFTTAGMQQFKLYYVGQADPKKDFGSKNTASCQKCIRTSDIEEVGDERHLTFFEMLGNFSFGGYWKKEAIELAYNFIAKELGLEIDYVTVFSPEKVADGDWRKGVPEDKESYEIWKNFVPERKIRKEGTDNFWGPTGDEGPCGPTTEIYVSGIEIWNIVFNEFFCNKNKELAKLDVQGIDTGMGLERLAMVMQNKPTVFETDLFLNILKQIPTERLYTEKEKRIIADHARAIVFLIADGVRPSNKQQGYILRRLIRRIPGSWQQDIFKAVVDKYQIIYPELNLEEIWEVINEEAKIFMTALHEGMVYFDKIKNPTMEDVFNVYQTYGLPIEAMKKKLPNFNQKEFDELLKKHQELSRTASAGMFKGGLADASEETTKLHTAAHLMLAGLRKVLGEHVVQKGSNITAERLRFDFSHKEKMTSEQLRDVENFVNGIIEKDLPVWFEEMPIEKAREINAMGVFESKYGQIVKVYFVGKNDQNVSKEICGGPHVEHTGVLGHFKIQKEESSSSGVRRIKAILE